MKLKNREFMFKLYKRKWRILKFKTKKNFKILLNSN